MKKNKHIGSTLDSFLEDIGVRKEVDAAAKKRVAAWLKKSKKVKS
jgi:hypothetical protein